MTVPQITLCARLPQLLPLKSSREFMTAMCSCILQASRIEHSES